MQQQSIGHSSMNGMLHNCSTMVIAFREFCIYLGSNSSYSFAVVIQTRKQYQRSKKLTYYHELQTTIPVKEILQDQEYSQFSVKCKSNYQACRKHVGSSVCLLLYNLYIYIYPERLHQMSSSQHVLHFVGVYATQLLRFSFLQVCQLFRFIIVYS